MKRVIVIGAGAAGLMAAGFASKNGGRVLLFESMYKPALKLGITGKGRCNITNALPINDFFSHYNNNGRFLRHALKSFDNFQVIDFFNSIGVAKKEERGKRIFPVSNNALKVSKALVNWVKKQNVDLLISNKVKKLIIENGICKGVLTCKGEKIFSDCVIVATGGKSYPLTGSTGDGYKFALQAGHKLVTPMPSLVPLKIGLSIPVCLLGFTLKNVKAYLLCNNKTVKSEFGEMCFYKNALAGPIIISLSREAVKLVYKKEKVFVKLDFKPALSHKQLDARLLREVDKNPKSSVKELMLTLLPHAMTNFFIGKTALNKRKLLCELTQNERKLIKNQLKEMQFEILGPSSWDEAIVTAGGVSLNEVNSKTMESKLVKNLFLAGEVLDIDADTGGFNLQAAFSTGNLAGISAVK